MSSRTAEIEFLTDDAVGWQAEAVAIEGERALEVVDAKGDKGNPGLHTEDKQGTARAASSPGPAFINQLLDTDE